MKGGREMKGETQASQVHICRCKMLKANLRNSWNPAAGKVERFCDLRITKSADPVREIIRFHVLCQPVLRFHGCRIPRIS